MAKDIQSQVQKMIDRLVEEGREYGLQIAAYYEGELVLDAWAGVMNKDSGTPVDGETLFPVFSTTKGVAATLMHILAEKGCFDYSDRIAKYWPGFGKNGKDKITIAQALSHMSAIPHVPESVTAEEMNDWEAMVKVVENLTPLYEPGSRIEYHAITYGWLVGEIIKRADGRDFRQTLREEICEPLGLTGMHVGIPAELEPKVATLYEPNAAPVGPNEFGVYAIPPSVQPLHKWMNYPEAHATCNPASNGAMNARSIAKSYAACIGEIDGVRLYPESRMKKATTLQIPTEPVGEDNPLRRCLGYVLGHPGEPMGSRKTAFGHAGYGGSQGCADPEYKLAVGFTKNYFSPHGTTVEVIGKIRELLNIPD